MHSPSARTIVGQLKCPSNSKLRECPYGGCAIASTPSTARTTWSPWKGWVSRDAEPSVSNWESSGRVEVVGHLSTGHCWTMALSIQDKNIPFPSSVYRKGSQESRLCSLVCSVVFYPALGTIIGCRCSAFKSVTFLSAVNPNYSFSSHPEFFTDLLNPPTSFPC